MIQERLKGHNLLLSRKRSSDVFGAEIADNPLTHLQGTAQASPHLSLMPCRHRLSESETKSLALDDFLHMSCQNSLWQNTRVMADPEAAVTTRTSQTQALLLSKAFTLSGTLWKGFKKTEKALTAWGLRRAALKDAAFEIGIQQSQGLRLLRKGWWAAWTSGCVYFMCTESHMKIFGSWSNTIRVIIEEIMIWWTREESGLRLNTIL